MSSFKSYLNTAQSLNECKAKLKSLKKKLAKCDDKAKCKKIKEEIKKCEKKLNESTVINEVDMQTVAGVALMANMGVMIVFLVKEIIKNGLSRAGLSIAKKEMIKIMAKPEFKEIRDKIADGSLTYEAFKEQVLTGMQKKLPGFLYNLVASSEFSEDVLFAVHNYILDPDKATHYDESGKEGPRDTSVEATSKMVSEY